MGSPGLAQLLNRVNLMYSLGGCVMIAGLMSESQARGKAGELSPYGLAFCFGNKTVLLRDFSDTSLVRSKARAHIFHIPCSSIRVEDGGLRRVKLSSLPYSGTQRISQP